jgi:hypothetical protein
MELRIDHCRGEFENRTLDISEDVARGRNPLVVSDGAFERGKIFVTPLSLAKLYKETRPTKVPLVRKVG